MSLFTTSFELKSINMEMPEICSCYVWWEISCFLIKNCTLKEEKNAEETFARRKIREI